MLKPNDFIQLSVLKRDPFSLQIKIQALRHGFKNSDL